MIRRGRVGEKTWPLIGDSASGSISAIALFTPLLIESSFIEDDDGNGGCESDLSTEAEGEDAIAISLLR